MAMKNKDFCVFILTHGRPDNICTIKALQECGYTGKTYLVIDNEDKTAQQYYDKFGKENVIMFDKKYIASITDEFDNFQDRRAIIYARNACFEIAKELGITYFLQLDDDYNSFDYRLYLDSPIVKKIKNLDGVFDDTLDFFKNTSVTSVAYAQGGDFIGGIDNGKELFRFSQRKAMNTFFCSTKKPFKFVGRINEDVNTYTSAQSKGEVFLTIQNISITQKSTQKNKGGMTDLYLQSGTYVKSFYTIMCAPSSTSIKLMQAKHARIHHSIDWQVAVPCIVEEKYKK